MTALEQLYNQKLAELTKQNTSLMDMLERQEREFLNQLRTNQQKYEESMKQIVTSHQEALTKLSKSEEQNTQILSKKLTELEQQIAIISDNQQVLHSENQQLTESLTKFPNLAQSLSSLEEALHHMQEIRRDFWER